MYGFRNEGFSLIELLVSIAIMGVLSALSVNIVADYRAKAFDMQALGFAHNLIMGQEAYQVDHGTYYPGCGVNRGPNEISCLGILPGLPEPEAHVVGSSGVSLYEYAIDQFSILNVRSCSTKGSDFGERVSEDNNTTYRYDSVQGYAYFEGRIFSPHGANAGKVISVSFDANTESTGGQSTGVRLNGMCDR